MSFTKFLVTVLGGVLGALLTFAIFDIFDIRMSAVLDRNAEVVAGSRHYFMPLGMLAGAIAANTLWSRRQARLDAKLPWNQKRQGGPILPNARSGFLEKR